MTVESMDFTPEVGALLRQAGLPVDDLPRDEVALIGYSENERLVGLAGIERCGASGLLRSVAADSTCRGRGLGRVLVTQAEQMALQQGLQRLFLLTTDAERYFEGLGYVRTERRQAPPEITETPQFATLCPDSAVLMAKTLTPALFPLAAAAVPASRGTVYPAPFAPQVAGRSKQKLGDFFGLGNFGVNRTTLEPGSVSALLHHHSRQDEMIYVLEGTPTLVLGDYKYSLLSHLGLTKKA